MPRTRPMPLIIARSDSQRRPLGLILTRAAFLFDWSGFANEGTGLFPMPSFPFETRLFLFRDYWKKFFPEKGYPACVAEGCCPPGFTIQDKLCKPYVGH